MCGIVGYVGTGSAVPILLEGLRKLEYRGYDSAGLAIHDRERLQVVRAAGKLINLARQVEERKVPAANLGIGHTRWATHGRPTEANAHPHIAGGVAVVHNGIIENHLELKRELEASGVVFQSDTDTEIVAHLIHRALEPASDLFAAVKLALRRLHGAYALAVLSESEPDSFVVAKHASPLVLGIGEDEALCASDVPALLEHTRNVLFLEDGEVARVAPKSIHIETLDGTVIDRAPRRIGWSSVQAEKSGYKHFMLKEIFEQPRAVADTLRGRILLEEAELVDDEIGIDPERLKDIDRVYFVACGTSYHAALAGRYWVERFARLPAQAELASEVRCRQPVFTSRDLVVAVSQSGETADTLAAMKAARDAGTQVLAIANVVDSAIPRAAHGALYTHAGPEIGVASTKCYTTQLTALLLLAIHLGRRKGALGAEATRELLKALIAVPAEMSAALERKDEIFDIARTWVHAPNFLFLGRGLSYPVALEGALKLKEISYAHAEGYAAGEMKHGAIALIDDAMPVVVVAPSDSQYEKTLGNIQEVRARDANVIAVVTQGDDNIGRLARHVVEVPRVSEAVYPLVTVLPLQLLSYYIADLKGTDVDQPRNLAKTVTVE